MLPKCRISESLERPITVDTESCPSGVYLRYNIEQVTNENGTKYIYKELFLTSEEYRNYLLICSIQGIDPSPAFINYTEKMNSEIEYPVNNFTYKAKYAEGTYIGLIEKGTKFPALFPLKIYDSTELEGRAVEMTITELTALTLFLASKQEQFFQEYKAEKTT